MADILILLVSHCDIINKAAKKSELLLYKCLSLELNHVPCDMRMTRLLLRHGGQAPYRAMLKLAFKMVPQTGADIEFFSSRFLHLVLMAGVRVDDSALVMLQNFAGLHDSTSLLKGYVTACREVVHNPMTLQCVCVIFVRKCLGTRLWKKIDMLDVSAQVCSLLKLDDAHVHV